MQIALATCHNLPGWEKDDLPFHAALERRNVALHRPIWDDPTVDWARFDATVIRTTWDYMEKCEAYVAWAERVATLGHLFNPPEVVRWNTHKTYLRDLEARGVPIAPTQWLEVASPVDVAEVMSRHGWDRGFIKPVIGATARATLRFHAREAPAAQTHLERYLPTEGMMIQPYLARVETEGEFSAIVFDGTPSHWVRKVPVPGDYRVQDDFGAHDEPWTPPDEARALASQALEAAATQLDLERPLLYGRVDMLLDDGGRFVLNELELVEPSLFFRHDSQAADRLADALLARLG